jgi:hypothetical protein
MVEFMREGGWGMWLVLALGAATLVTAILFAREPDERRMALIRGLTAACSFSILTALASNLATVMHHVPQDPELSSALSRVTMIGIGESLAPVILGSAFLTLSWIVTAVGMRRLGERLAQVLAGAS